MSTLIAVEINFLLLALTAIAIFVAFRQKEALRRDVARTEQEMLEGSVRVQTMNQMMEMNRVHLENARRASKATDDSESWKGD